MPFDLDGRFIGYEYTPDRIADDPRAQAVPGVTSAVETAIKNASSHCITGDSPENEEGNRFNATVLIDQAGGFKPGVSLESLIKDLEDDGKGRPDPEKRIRQRLVKNLKENLEK